MLEILLDDVLHEAETAILRKLLKKFLHDEGAMSTSIICLYH